MHVGQFFQHLRVIDGVVVDDLDFARALTYLSELYLIVTILKYCCHIDNITDTFQVLDLT